MSDSHIKNTKEVLSLVFYIIKPIIREIKKDGFQFTDLVTFMGDEEFQQHLQDAINDVGGIPDEIRNFSLKEGFELSAFLVDEVKDLIVSLF